MNFYFRNDLDVGTKYYTLKSIGFDTMKWFLLKLTYCVDYLTSCHLNNKGDDDMPREGEKERVFNDPTATAGSVMGIQAESGQEKNISNYIPKQDPEMKQFEKLMRGHKLED